MLTIRTPILRRLHSDWESRRNGRVFPARSDFDILDLRYAVGQLALLDVSHGPLRFRFRLHGTGITQRVGYDMTGKDLDDLPSPEVRASVRRHLTDVVEQGAPLVEMRDRVILDGLCVSSEVLALPLARDGSSIDMLMLGVVFF